MGEIIGIRSLSKRYQDQSGTTLALDGITLSIQKGDIYGIIGLSGAGKSTLVRCINKLEVPTAGSIVFHPWEGKEVDIAKLKSKDLSAVRKRIAMIFQSFNLMQQRTALDNVMFPMTLVPKPKVKRDGSYASLADELNAESYRAVPHSPEARKARALELLDLVGIKNKADAYPSQLSGGQQQRVAIARALALNPDVLLSDESTSALDPAITQSILALLKDLNKKLGLTIVLITHQMPVIEAVCNKVALIDKSHIAEEGTVEEVFSHPKSDIAKKLLYSERMNTKLSSTKRIRLLFEGNSDEPIVAEMIEQCHTLVSILFADSKMLDGKIYGQMVLQLPYYDEDIATIKAFLTKKHVKFEELENEPAKLD